MKGGERGDLTRMPNRGAPGSSTTASLRAGPPWLALGIAAQREQVGLVIYQDSLEPALEQMKEWKT